MDSENIYDKINSILKELYSYPADYMALLSDTEKIAFIQSWTALCQRMEGVHLPVFWLEMKEIISAYPKLSKELLRPSEQVKHGNPHPDNPKETLLRFDPGNVKSTNNTNLIVPEWIMVLIKNEIIKVRDSLQSLEHTPKNST